ncbi:hypothetical protein [Nocardioides speluncae]|uniref:hypothetical protein n=1 Tax=Nocardioides speluncae TaxID=2670337 RepID=UPI0012B16DAE|nr:hypothetical protein [Nocardioides speluncae]
MRGSRARRRAFGTAALLVLAAPAVVPPPASAADGITVSIAKHANLTPGGGVVISVQVTCPQLPGSLDFQEAHAGASQDRTGAWSESGLDGTVVCDGQPHVHTAHFTSFADPFKGGPASANASVIVCHIVGEEQVCATGSSASRIVIRG